MSPASSPPLKLITLDLVAWVGEDEFGSGVFGLKQAETPAGIIPLAAIRAHEEKLRRLKPQLEAQAVKYGKRIRLCRFTFMEVLDETEAGR
jgi:hypothetical protein